ncbi:MAG TPA: pyruvate, phosphate dikinase, partial [Actinobacteria bacterium]|nr:pyruvate, phosphate dikinase [Actinomycetota bacterium]
MTRWVYRFDEVELAEKAVGGDWEEVRGLLGGKGANLAEMTRIGVPVPPGFTITSEACNAYLVGGGRFPEGLEEEVAAGLAAIEAATGRRFGDPENPLLVSCRSGARFSMPGMMDTILNLGMNAEVTASMAESFGDLRFAYDSYRRLLQMFAGIVLGVNPELFEEVLAEFRERRGVRSDAELTGDDLVEIVERFDQIVTTATGRPFPSDPRIQLDLAIRAVFDSWNGKRAVDYRNAAGIPHDLGTAVNVQAMVFGNRDDRSGTGVAMSRNATTGEPTLEGDYLMRAQGEDVVAGIRQTKPIEALSHELPEVYEELVGYARLLERHYRDMQDMEFTIESGKLWLLQTRNAKRTAQAAVRVAVDMVEEGMISRDEALLRVSPEHVDFFLHPQFAP